MLVLKDFLIFLLDYNPSHRASPNTRQVPLTPTRTAMTKSYSFFTIQISPAEFPDWAKDPFPSCSQNPVMISRLNLTYYIETNCLSICLSSR